MELAIGVSAVILTVISNFCAIAYFAGVLNTTQNHHKEVICDIKTQFEKSVNDLKLQLKEDIEDLKERQDKYNNVICRTYDLERGQLLHEEQIKVANHRIEDLEERK